MSISRFAHRAIEDLPFWTTMLGATLGGFSKILLPGVSQFMQFTRTVDVETLSTRELLVNLARGMGLLAFIAVTSMGGAALGLIGGSFLRTRLRLLI